ncbi:hypothetical protein ACHAO4_007016 [Trichoderma viride]
MTKIFASQGKENSDGCYRVSHGPWVCAPCYGEPGQEPEARERQNAVTPPPLSLTHAPEVAFFGVSSPRSRFCTRQV